MPYAIGDGATLTCTGGVAPAPLTVAPPTSGSGMEMALATIDMAQPMLNIPSFGTCAFLTAAAGGVPTPCLPATAAWTPGATAGSLDMIPLATETCQCPCAVGGVITVAVNTQMLVEAL